MAATAEGLSLASVEAQERPKAIVLDLVNPATPVGGSADSTGT